MARISPDVKDGKTVGLLGRADHNVALPPFAWYAEET
jgi:hypothetical protein